jgi:hypothetical protein
MADTPRYYRVSPKFWATAEQRGWDDDAKLLALYLLTGPHRTTEGIFRLPRKYAQADLDWSPQRFAERLGQLIADGFCDYDDDAQVVIVLGAMKYQSTANDNMVTAALRRLRELPETRLTSTFEQLAERFDQRLHQRLPEGFGEPQALALAPALAPSPGESSTQVDAADGESDAADPSADDASEFEAFWGQYPARGGKKLGKAAALVEWHKLTAEQRGRALVGARNLAASDQLPKDAERFLRRGKGGAFPFDDWQEPAKPDRGAKRLHNVTEISVGGRF